ncbi:MAG TPA: hypothetical protein VLH37_10475 [Bacteroidales bacterium]|nr:hypothetical protein [Bacteroidales bacterium]
MDKDMATEKSQPQGFSPKKTSSNIAPIIFLSIIAVVLAIGGALLLRSFFEVRQLAADTVLERDEVLSRNQELLARLSELDESFKNVSAQNATLQQDVEKQRNEIRQLRSQVRTLSEPLEGKTVQEVVARIGQLEKELADHIARLLFLEEENKRLAGEGTLCQDSLAASMARLAALSEKNRALNERLESGARLAVMNLEVITTRQARRGESITDRGRRVRRIQVCFTIMENLLAVPGQRIFYLRIVDPAGNLITGPDSGTFNVTGAGQMEFSGSASIEYKNAQLATCITHTLREGLPRGVYKAEVFTEGRQVGSQLFELR